jgi:hypothetical protein
VLDSLDSVSSSSFEYAGSSSILLSFCPPDESELLDKSDVDDESPRLDGLLVRFRDDAASFTLPSILSAAVRKEPPDDDCDLRD